jgi:hypothetical protein
LRLSFRGLQERGILAVKTEKRLHQHLFRIAVKTSGLRLSFRGLQGAVLEAVLQGPSGARHSRGEDFRILAIKLIIQDLGYHRRDPFHQRRQARPTGCEPVLPSSSVDSFYTMLAALAPGPQAYRTHSTA